MKSKSEIEKAKKYPIRELLSDYNHQPIRESNGTLLYSNPLRTEKEPSFYVYPATNTFWDYGSGEKRYSVIDLLMLLENISFSKAVDMILEKNFSFISPILPEKEPEEKYFKIDSIKPLSNPYFIKYIEKRKLNVSFAKMYLKEIYYKTSQNQLQSYFGIGMENQSGGFEVKNSKSGKYYCLGSKDATIITNPQYRTWSIFEGMFDFLASMTHSKKLIQSNVIILHTINTVDKILEIPTPDTEKVYLFLDNDSAGNKATEQLTNHFSQFFQVIDCRKLYQGYKDFNEFLTGKSSLVSVL